MPASTLTVSAHITAKEDLADEVKHQLTALLEPTRQEEGCISYDLYNDTEHPERFLFVECWRSRQDLDKHLATLHVMKFLDKAAALLAEPIAVSVWASVEE